MHMTNFLQSDVITRAAATNVPLKYIRISDNIENIIEKLFIFATQLEKVEFANDPKIKIIEKDAFPSGKIIILPKPVDDGKTFLHWNRDGQHLNAGTEVSDYSVSYNAVFEDDITSVKDFNSNESNYHLYGLYPNPFSDKTTLKLDFDKPSTVSISIIDPLGRVVQNIMRDEKLDGHFSIPIEFNNATDYRMNAIYYCRIIIDNHVETLKLLYVE